MKKIFLLVIIANIIAQNSFAECIVPPSCSDMGYTQNISDCAGGKSLKCPFDTSKVICLNQEGSDSATTAPATECIDGALVFADGTCSFYESYETDDNPALGVYYTASGNIWNPDTESYYDASATYAIWGGYMSVANLNAANAICAEKGGYVFGYDNFYNYETAVPTLFINKFSYNTWSTTFSFNYKTKNILFVAPNSILGVNRDLTSFIRAHPFYCFKIINSNL